MSTATDIQKSIDSAISARQGWNAELIKFNGQLVSAKGSAKTRIKRAINNAEDQIKDLDRSILNLTNDLKRVSLAETRNESKVILAEKGISPASQIVGDLVSGAKEIIGQVNLDSLPITDKQKKSTTTEPDSEGMAKYLKAPYLYYIIGGVVLLILLMKKK
jgi:uncharacterized protein (UPF0297 family)